MTGVGLSNTIICRALVLSSGMSVSVLNDQGHAGNRAFPTGQHVILPSPGDGWHRIA